MCLYVRSIYCKALIISILIVTFSYYFFNIFLIFVNCFVKYLYICIELLIKINKHYAKIKH